MSIQHFQNIAVLAQISLEAGLTFERTRYIPNAAKYLHSFPTY